MTFQMTFAVITPALIVGAFAERLKFSAMLWFMAAWLTLVYVPIWHWVWGGGWIADLGALDFAGGTVVHINAGIATGAVAGLVAITPASGTAGPMGAIAIGFARSLFAWIASTKIKRALGYDDSLDVWGVHGVAGIVGAILTGVFADASLGGAGLAEGMTIGSQVWIQLLSVLATLVYGGIVSFVILKIIDMAMGLRVTEDQEAEGLDLALHDERGYIL